jgi:hypothetical protein
MFYATHDFDGDRIISNADIRGFKTLEEAELFLRAPFGAKWDMKEASVIPGRFGDCWIKTLTVPHLDDRWLAPFEPDDLCISGPGSHPGGRAWWITPSVDVLVITGARERDAA